MKRTTRAKRRITAAAAVACAAGLWPASALAAQASPASAGAAVPACETPGLVVWLNTTANGAAGSISYQMEFTNLSGHRCTLNGFPFVFAVGLEGHQIGRRASFDRSQPPQTVTIRAGRTATAVLKIEEVGDFSPSACGPRTAAGFRVFPPNQTRAKTIPFPFAACSTRGPKAPVYLTMGPVTK
jgi:Protein of unknown function (DUF4232)